MIRLKPFSFVRLYKDECLVSSPKEGSSVLLRDAGIFLQELSYEWQGITKIVEKIARQFNSSYETVYADLSLLLSVLDSNRLIDCKTDKMHYAQTVQSGVLESSCSNADIGYSYFDFYLNNHLIADLHIDLTDMCNERCVHCYIPHDRKLMIDTDVAIKVLQEFRAMQGLTVLFSGGECLLHPQFEKIVFEAQNLNLNIVLMSNLIFADKNKIDVIKRINPQFVNVSLYSMKSEEHDKITGVPGSWSLTKSAIERLRAEDVEVRLATPLMRINKEAIRSILEYACSINANVTFDCDIIGCINHTNANRFYALDKKELEDVMRKYKERLCYLGQDIKYLDKNSKVCEIGDFSINLNANCDYYPCDGFHGMVLGNARHETLYGVWRGEKLGRLRRLKYSDFGECASCPDKPWCKVCPMRNFNETGDMYNHADFRCDLARLHKRMQEET